MSENPNAQDSGDSFNTMKESAGLLVQKLEEGDYSGARHVIQVINEERDQSIYAEVGRLTRAIHESIVDFNVDLAEHGIAERSEDGSEIISAKDRLDHVITLCKNATDTTMDMVEEGIPISESLSTESAELREEWGKLLRREMNPDEFRELYKRIDTFLGSASGSASDLNQKFTSILMAQEYQDLTGQIIQKVIKLVQEVEGRLVGLVKLASQVEQVTGVVEAAEKIQTESASELEGPQINAQNRSDVVSGQDEVDDLLSSLGF